jgi:heme ABC exporter ATP-binding subunit CcmA
LLLVECWVTVGLAAASLLRGAAENLGLDRFTHHRTLCEDGAHLELHWTLSQQVDSSAAIRAQGLGRRFGRNWALAHIDLEIPSGQIVLLAGSNGSGKTTLLRLIAGLYKPSAGDLRVFAKKPAHDRLDCRRLLSLVAHDNFLYDRLTPLENLRIWSRLLGRKTTGEELEALLDKVDLRSRKDSQVGGFSAGMKKRLTLLRTRLEDPKLILMDEPFSALDAAGKRLVEHWVQDSSERGKTVVMASHDLRRATRICQQAVLLEQGQIVWQGEAEGVLRRAEAGQ